MNETNRYLLERLRKQIFSYGSLCSLYAELTAKNVNGEYCHEIRGKREEAANSIRILLREIQAHLARAPNIPDKRPWKGGIEGPTGAVGEPDPCCEDIGDGCCVREDEQDMYCYPRND